MVEAETYLDVCDYPRQTIGIKLTSPTIFERMITWHPVPYALSFVLIALFIGPLGDFLFYFSVTNNIQISFGHIIGISYMKELDSNINSLNLSSLVANMIWYAFLFYGAFLVKHLRMHLEKAEKALILLAPEGKKTVLKVFKSTSKALPQLIIATVFLLIFATSVEEVQNIGQFKILSIPIYVSRSFFRSMMLGSVLWLCFSSLWCLYKFGKLPLKLKSCHEDPMIGTRELGSLSFSVTSAYFLGLALFATQTVIGGLTGNTPIINLIIIIVLVPLGIGLFFAPLMSIHSKMVEIKKAELASARKMFSDTINEVKDDIVGDQHLIRLLMLEVMERKAISIRTWPVDNPVMGKLALITISVTATMIARLIQILLKI